MGVVALAALDEIVDGVGVDADERFLLVAVEAAALETEAAAAAHTVTLRAFHAGDRRVVLKRFELGRGILADEETHLLAAAVPNER